MTVFQVGLMRVAEIEPMRKVFSDVEQNPSDEDMDGEYRQQGRDFSWN